MKVKLNNPQLLANVITIISEMVAQVRLKFKDEYMELTAIDPANVALTHLIIPKTSFVEYQATDETLGVNLDNFKNVLRRCKIGSKLTMESEDNLLKMDIEDKVKRSFTLALIDIDHEEKQMPNLSFKAEVEVDSQTFVESIEDCYIVADSASLEAGNDKFIIEAKSLNSARSEFSSDEARITATERCKSKYSLEYMQKFLKAAKFSEKIYLSFGNEYPLRMDFRNNVFELSFILAPRVETE